MKNQELIKMLNQKIADVDLAKEYMGDETESSIILSYEEAVTLRHALQDADGEEKKVNRGYKNPDDSYKCLNCGYTECQC